MNIVKLYGGLGNQMFQYAFGKNLEVNRGMDVMYDTSWFGYHTDPPRPYGLNKFNTHVSIMPFIAGNRTIHEGKDEYYNYEDTFTRRPNTNLAGYWQHIDYMREVLPILREEFRIDPEYQTIGYIELKERILGSSSVGIHVRRGDYVTVAGHHVLGMDYYREALKYVKGKVYVFSDDIKWCEEHFPGAQFINMMDYLSFSLLCFCKCKIIANSTFSWWAAILNENEEDVVVAPKIWRANVEEQRRMEEGKFCPNNWIQI